MQGCSCSSVLRSSHCHNAGTGPIITDLLAGPPLKKTCSSSQSSLWVSLTDPQDGPKLPMSLSPHPEGERRLGGGSAPGQGVARVFRCR